MPKTTVVTGSHSAQGSQGRRSFQSPSHQSIISVTIERRSPQQDCRDRKFERRTVEEPSPPPRKRPSIFLSEELAMIILYPHMALRRPQHHFPLTVGSSQPAKYGAAYRQVRGAAPWLGSKWVS